MNPLVQFAAQLGVGLLTSPRPPTQAQIDAALAAQRAAELQKWIIGGALAGGALLVYLVASRR